MCAEAHCGVCIVSKMDSVKCTANRHMQSPDMCMTYDGASVWYLAAGGMPADI